MNRISRILYVGVFLSSLLLAAGAQAQGITIFASSVEGRDAMFSDLVQTPLSREECENNIVIDFRIENIPTNKTRLDFWRGSDCNTTEQRGVDGTCDLLSGIPDTAINGDATKESLEIGVQSLVQCDQDATETIWVLAVDTEDESVDASAYGRYQIQIAVNPPAAPSGVRGDSGDTQIPVSWNTPTDSGTFEHVVYVDATNASSSTCSSTLLAEGQEVPDNTDQLKSYVVDGNASSTNINGGDIEGFDYGEQALVAVVARDISGNESVLSNTACISRVQTLGYWQQYCQQSAGNADCDSGCSLTPGSTVSLDIALLLLALGLVVQRRKWRRG